MLHPRDRLPPEQAVGEAKAASQKFFPEPGAAGSSSPVHSQQLLKSVLESSLDGVIVFRAVREGGAADGGEGGDEAPRGSIVDFEFVLVNPVAADVLGSSSADLVGQRLSEVFPGFERQDLFESYVRVAETGEPMRHEHVEGANIEGSFRVSAVRVDDGLAVTFHDVTAHVQAKDELKKTNEELRLRNRELEDFAHIASHDLQEPLRKVRAFAGLMREDYADAVDDTGRYYLERMQDGAERMSRLVSDLLSLSRVTTQGHPFEQVDLGEVAAVVRTDLELRIEETGGRVEIGALPSLEADHTQMHQLLQNLIGNALKFHREGVSPVVRVHGACEPASAPDHRPEAAPSGPVPACHLVVEDNGIGFESKFADRIFTPLQRLHSRDAYQGTGIGLAVCRRIAERHGGTIEAKSRKGAGSCFTVRLPAKQSQNGKGSSPNQHRV